MNKRLIFGLALALVLVSCTLFSHSVLAEDLKFDLLNHASDAVVGFQTSPVTQSSWGANLMEGYELPPNHKVAVSIEDGVKICEYDIRVIFSDGSKIEDNDVDLCKLGSYTVRD